MTVEKAAVTVWLTAFVCFPARTAGTLCKPSTRVLQHQAPGQQGVVAVMGCDLLSSGTSY